MLVYGDHREHANPRQRLDSIAIRLDFLRNLPAGLERHAQLVAALVEAGQLQQGLEDSGSRCVQVKAFVHGLAVAVVRSWDSRFGDIGQLPEIPAAEGPDSVELRLPEGFAFYAVYPEAYADAARRLRLSGPPRVIGIRSIGTTLGAVVAAALGAEPATTVRPFGDPFARQVELPSEILEGDAHYVIVDEGPGLSGSSFGAVADWLEARRVPLERIAFIPGHGGDLGPQASGPHGSRWRRAQIRPAAFDPSMLLAEYGPLEELSRGGAWERRKFLGSVNDVRVLLKFAGLGRIGERKLAMARALHAAGFTPEPLGLAHGFLIERWHGEARPLQASDDPVEEIGRYIGGRARLFPADEGSGATIEELLAMCRRNISLALGNHAAGAVEQYDPDKLANRVRRVRSDNKLDRSEWLRLADGRLLKTDALDHHQGHDLIGCQGVEWDLVGAIVEFDLRPDDSLRLIRAAGVAADTDLLHFYRLAYIAFRLGLADLAGHTVARERYLDLLQHLLHRDSALATHDDSWVRDQPERTASGTNHLFLG